MNYKLNIKLGKKDYVNFLIYNFLHKPHIVPVIISTIGVIRVYAQLSNSYENVSAIFLVLTFLVSNVILITFEFIIYLIISLQKKDKSYEVTITPDKINIKIEKQNVEYEWKQFLKIKENSKYFFLYVKTSNAILLPKKDFGSKEEIQNLQKFFKK